MDIEEWKRRYTVRKFDETFIPDDNQIQHIVDVIEYVPSQEGKFDHLWLVLSPEDKTFKRWLVENIFYFQQGLKKQYMIQILTAPYIFLSITLSDKKFNTNDVNRNIGIHAGIILSEALSLGLDVATIGCRAGHQSNKDLLTEQFNEIIKKDYKELILNNVKDHYKFKWKNSQMFEVNLAVCVGKGLPLETGRWGRKKLANHEGFEFCPYQKRKKLVKNVIYRDNHGKL